MLSFKRVELGVDTHKVELYVVEVAGGRWALLAHDPASTRTWSINYNEEMFGAFSTLTPVHLRETRVEADGTVAFRDAEDGPWVATKATVE